LLFIIGFVFKRAMANTHSPTQKLHQLLVFSMIVTLGLTTVSCSFSSTDEAYQNQPQAQQSVSPAPQTQLADGQYPVQQVTYDDATGEYRVILLNTAPGQPSIFQTSNLPMARLTEQETANRQTNYLNVENNQPSLHLTEDFRIEYVHNVAETVPNPQTGQSETVVVRRETGFWAPFAGALAGQALGNLLFTPHYYMPPVFRPGVVVVGYGGYGRTYDQAVSRYQTRYQTPPAEVRNRRILRTAGRLRSPSYGQSRTRTTQPSRDRATGSGYGSSNLRRDRVSPSRPTYRRPSGFGTGRSRSLGRRRR
jgi:hypothetical protein